ncbi:MAG: hypothetical protein M1503_09665 [Thaumarchaeota archaeon]|nr:hypothetical protein [Nitrososphaerota archaeon]MCL5318506.1 hypothetical protein [Nitrososphaerota archaeon]
MHKKSRHAAVALVVFALSTALMVPEAAFAISNPPYVGLAFDPQSTKPLNILAGGSATFGMSTLVNLNWDDGNISLSEVHAPWVNVTIAPNLFTGITKGDYYNSKMTVKITQDAPEGLTSITVHANAVLIMDINGSRRIYRLEDTKNITLNIIHVPVRTTTVTTILSQHELPPTTVTTTVSTTLTNTMTNTSTEQVSDRSTTAWAVSATAATVVLAAVLLVRRRTK